MSLFRIGIAILAVAMIPLTAFAQQDDRQGDRQGKVEVQDLPTRVKDTIRRELDDARRQINDLVRRVDDEKRKIQDEQRRIEQIQHEMDEIGRNPNQSAQRMMEANRRYQDSNRKIRETERKIKNMERQIDHAQDEVEDPKMKIWWRMRNGKPAYELDMRIPSLRKNIELVIAENGMLLRRREEVEEKDLPKAVMETVRREVSEADFERVEGAVRYTENRSTWYEINVDRRKGRGDNVTLWIMADGKLLNTRGLAGAVPPDPPRRKGWGRPPDPPQPEAPNHPESSKRRS